MIGWVRLHRKLWSSGLFPKEQFSEREAWLWLIANAAWQDTETTVNGVRLTVKRGQVATTSRSLAERFGWTQAKVARFTKRLTRDSAIDSLTDSRMTVITICNYDEYQTRESTGDSPTDSPNIYTTDSPIDSINKEDKEYIYTSSSLRSEEGAGAPPDVILYQTARSVLGEKHIGSVTKLRNKVGDAQAQAILDAAREKADPVSYFYGALKSARPALTQGEIAGGIYYDSQGRKRCTL